MPAVLAQDEVLVVSAAEVKNEMARINDPNINPMSSEVHHELQGVHGTVVQICLRAGTGGYWRGSAACSNGLGGKRRPGWETLCVLPISQPYWGVGASVHLDEAHWMNYLRAQSRRPHAEEQQMPGEWKP